MNDFQLAILVNDQLQVRLDEGRTFTGKANREFEGDLQMKGQSVIVENMPVQAWADHTIGNDVAITGTTTEKYTITVSQSKEIGRRIDSIEQIRSAFNLEGGIFDASAQGLIDLQETHYINQIRAAAPTAHELYEASPTTANKTTIHALIEEMAVMLDLANVPKAGRYLAVKPQIASMLRQSGLFVYTETGISKLVAGEETDIAGFIVVSTNRISTNHMVGFVPQRTHFIDQLSSIEVNKNPKGKGYFLVGESYYQADAKGEDAKCIVTLKYA
jgi:hypothetical protein